MARKIDRLSAVHLTKKPPGMHCDGAGLYLQVTTGGARSWVYRFKVKGRARDMGLGSLDDVSLAEAREKAVEARRLVRDGRDPIEYRKAVRASQRLTEARGKTFRQAAEEYIAAHEVEWRNSKHRAQWRSTLATYAYPVIGNLAVSDITTQDVHAVLSPIWADKPETASRIRGRIETIINAARADDDDRWSNPARWERHKHRLAKRAKVAPVRHHPALDRKKVRPFMSNGSEGLTRIGVEELTTL